MNNENYIIVNENDEIIGYKKRNDIISSDIYRVSGLIIENLKGQFLLAQRSFKKKNDPGQWSISVAGTIEEGETYLQNIIKETEEEIGIKVTYLQTLEKIRIYGEHNYFVQMYKIKLDKKIEDFVIQKDEVEKIRWFNTDEIKKGIFEGNTISKFVINNIELFKNG